MIYIDICGGTKVVKNTGANEQCLYSPTVGYALATEDFAFASIAAFKTKVAWDAAKLAKSIAVMFSVEASELSNTEASFYESRTVKYRNKRARKGISFTHHLGLCSHSALESYEGSAYSRVFEFTADGNIKGVLQSDGTVKGQKLSDFTVGQIEEPVIEGDPQKTVVQLAYKNYKEFQDNGAIVEPDFDVEDYTGVFGVTLTVVGTPTATELVLRATAGCSGDIPVEGLVIGDFAAIKDSDGTDNTPDSVTPGAGADANLYTFVDTDLVSGSISVAPVAQGDVVYEAESVSFTV